MQDGGVGAEGLLGDQRREDPIGLFQRTVLDQKPGVGRNGVGVGRVELVRPTGFLLGRTESPGGNIQARRDLQRRGIVAAFHDRVQEAQSRLLLTQRGKRLDAQNVELVAQGSGRRVRLVGQRQHLVEAAQQQLSPCQGRPQLRRLVPQRPRPAKLLLGRLNGVELEIDLAQAAARLGVLRVRLDRVLEMDDRRLETPCRRLLLGGGEEFVDLLGVRHTGREPNREQERNQKERGEGEAVLHAVVPER